MNKSYEDGYNKGIEDMADAVGKIAYAKDRGGIPVDDLIELFGSEYVCCIFRNYSATDIIKKIKAYGEIKVGDEIEFERSSGAKTTMVVTFIRESVFGHTLYDGICLNGETFNVPISLSVKKTGRHFEELMNLLTELEDK